jgi:hypothetical protein
MKTRKDAWTRIEDEILGQYFSCREPEALCKLLPNRTWASIRKRAYSIGLDKGELWSADEEQYLIENYVSGDRESIIQRIGRAWGGIKMHAQRLGLRRVDKVLKFWTPEEEDLLRKIYPLADWKEILKAFPSRKRSNINEKASALGIRRLIHAGKARIGGYAICKNSSCGKSFYQPPSRSDRPFCSQKCSFEHLVGENAPNWMGGKSFEPYPPTFNARFKRMICKRDNYTCKICKGYGNNIHHINYVKDDTNPENCVTLCRSCHTKTNFNREYWIEYFAKLMR